MSDTLLARKNRIARAVIYGLSVVVLVAVVILFSLPKPEKMPVFATYLPGLNATLNSACTLLLVGSWFAIRRGNRALHKRMNLFTFMLSAIFLVSYVVYHGVGPETRFPADNPWRPVYLTVLISHVVLAAVVLPMVLFSFYYALTGQFDIHRRIVRYSHPIWLYVTATGVIVYWMIAPHYPF